jgi:hypothetical protein
MHIPMVILGGYIKTYTKNKWETIINDKSLARFEHHDRIEEEKSALRALPVDENTV